MAGRPRALLLAVCVILAVALATGGVVIANTIGGGPGYEVLNGSAGNDTINARDNGPDTIDCGAGIDKVYVDRAEDGVFDCETVVTP
jgi:Ca2+-binding RTX toxin-like protein